MFRSSMALVALGLAGSLVHAADPELDTKRIESITGLTGTYNQADAHLRGPLADWSGRLRATSDC